jgi:hypothetical protein
MRRALIAASVMLTIVVGAAGTASAHPSTQANCIGTANSNGQGEFASGIATTVRSGEIGRTTADILGGGLIGTVASADDCS